MESITYSNFRKDLTTYIKKVNDEASGPIIVTSDNAEDAIVVMSKRDYDSMQETMRVLSNSYLMKKVRKGDEQFESLNFKTHELIEID
ncbi:type II toxin-antitoxin system Phd/YefM family antitoxin [Enterococcus sp. AZ109]|uniref:type II toxin-antitoxin system Phd/YefM family antitoxin n=1 Tax=Enterococcus sp. AZ109 TaxID=2774634 RepID=UPI003F1F8741